MKPNPILRPLALLLSFSGTIQGLVWLAAGVLGILTYDEIVEIPEFPLAESTHIDLITYALKRLYFSSVTTNLKVSPKAFVIFMILYVMLSLFWTVISGVAFCMSRCSHWKGLRNSLIVYCLLTTLVTVVDLTFMSMLIADYRKVANVKFVIGVRAEITYTLIAIGMMFTLAARGYVLLLANIASIVYCVFYCIAYPTSADGNDNQILYNIPIDAYKEYPGDVNFAEAINEEPIGIGWARAYSNHAYAPNSWDSTEMILQADKVQVYPEMPEQPVRLRHVEMQKPTPPVPPAPLWLDGLSRPDNNRETSEEKNTRRVPFISQYALPTKASRGPPPMPPPKPSAKLPKPHGKKGPPIPFPDYSPPASPKELRSVIKPHSSYY